MDFDLRGKRVFVAGHRGMVGSAIVRRLADEDCEVLTASRDELDLMDQAGVRRWMAGHRPDAVVMAAAKVGGILANNRLPVDFLQDNLIMQTNVIESAFRNEVQKLLFLGSSCIYPKFAAQPISEDALLTGPLEPTNEWYAIAKIAGLKLCQAYRRQYGVEYISAMPTNLYGPGDNFDLSTSHVAASPDAQGAQGQAALATKPWRSGIGHADARVPACRRRRRRSGLAAEKLCRRQPRQCRLGRRHHHCRTGPHHARRRRRRGGLTFDATKPDGTPRKLMDVSRLFATGWRPRYSLQSGLEQTYAWFLQHIETG